MLSLSKFDGPYAGPAAAGILGAASGSLFVAARNNIGQYVPQVATDLFSRFSPISIESIASAADSIGTYTGLSSISYLGLSSIIGVSVGVKTAASYALAKYEINEKTTWPETFKNIGLHSLGSLLAVGAGTAAGVYIGGVSLSTSATLAAAYPLAHLIVKVSLAAWAALNNVCITVKNFVVTSTTNGCAAVKEYFQTKKPVEDLAPVHQE